MGKIQKDVTEAAFEQEHRRVTTRFSRYLEKIKRLEEDVATLFEILKGDYQEDPESEEE